MTGRLEGKTGIVVGAGQTPGETIGNGRASSIVFAREGARLVLVDRDLGAAKETASMITDADVVCVQADWTSADDCRTYVAACIDAFGRIDFLHNNVGIGAGDATLLRLEEDVFDRILRVNLKGCMLSCKAVLPQMREQQSGSIVNISSIAAVASTNLTAYKISKLGMNALSQNLANSNARYGVRVNTIMPGLMDTPMAIEGMVTEGGLARDDIRQQRDRAVPLRAKMGTGWDIANAALFLHSDEANFITGVVLPVDGGQSARIG